MKDMTFSNIEDKLFEISEDLEKLEVGLTTYNRELVTALDNHIAIHLARPFYEIAVDYTDKAQRAINELRQHILSLHEQANEIHHMTEE